MFEHTFIGLDVHAVNVVGHALNPATGETNNHTMAADPAMVLEWVRQFEPPVKAVYESGPTAFVLARYLQAAGISCVVAASSKLLRAPGDRIKTDRRDARVLAKMLAVGSATEVRIPDLDEEALRDLSRLRSGMAKDLAHARQHVNAILLRHGIRYPKDTWWTKEHREWLHRQRFEELALQFTYEADVEQPELLVAHLSRIDKHAAASRYSPVLEAVMCPRGIQMTTASGWPWRSGTGPDSAVRPSVPTSGWCPARSPPVNPGTRARSPRPGTPMPANSSSKRRGNTAAPTPGPGND